MFVGGGVLDAPSKSFVFKGQGRPGAVPYSQRYSGTKNVFTSPVPAISFSCAACML